MTGSVGLAESIDGETDFRHSSEAISPWDNV